MTRAALVALLVPSLLATLPCTAGALGVPGQGTQPAVAAPGMPIVFVENQGQQPAEARFSARAGDLSAWFTDQGARLLLRADDGVAVALFLSLEARGLDAAGGPGRGPVGDGEPAGRGNVYRGNDPARWVVGAPAFEALRYAEAAPGVDLVFRERDGLLSYDLELAPGADATGLVLRCEGADGLSLDDAGRLVVHTAAGALVQTPPLAWERDVDGVRQFVHARVRLLDGERWGFDVARRDAAAALVIDPGLTWGSHLGGSLSDGARAVGLATLGHVIVAGTTGSPNFPTTAGAVQGAIAGFNDAFVARIDPATGSLVFATYFGGNDTVIFRPDVIEDLAVGSDGFIVVAGTAASVDFPTTAGAFQETTTGGTDGFVARFHPGGFLVWSTRLGGSGNDEATALALDDDGVVTAVGLAFSNNFPTTPGAFDTSYNSIALTDDGWVARLTADGSALVWSTYLGGNLRDELRDVALDAAGRPVVVGLTGASNFPATGGAFDSSFNGAGASNTDAIVARFSADGSALEWATYLGGAGIVEGNGLALAANGDVLVVGETRSTDFPVALDALQPQFGGGTCDGFLTRLSADGSALVWSTFLGGGGDDALQSVALTSGDQATAVGSTTSSDVLVKFLPSLGLASGSGGASSTAGLGGAAGAPVAGGGFAGSSAPPFDVSLAGSGDALIARFSVDGDRLIWATLYGGSGFDEATDVVLEDDGAAWVVGLGDSIDLPLAGTPVQSQAQGANDAFVARFAVPPTYTVGYGLSARGDPPRLRGVGAFERGTSWELSLEGATPGARGWLLLGGPGAVGTLGMWPVLAALPLEADAAGAWSVSGAAWPLPRGSALAMQLWLPGAAGLGPSASAGLLVETP